MNQTAIQPVLIVGAGPTGMTAALDLAHYGIPSILLDEDNRLSGGSRAIVFHHSALAVWEKLGAGEAMLKKGLTWSARHTYFRQKKLYTQNFPQPGEGFLPRFINLQQYYIERYLLDQIEKNPLIDLRWEHFATGFWQNASSATLKVETPGGMIELSSSYVLACDGARSSMRKLLNLGFPGKTHTDHFLIADIKADLNFPPQPRFFFDHPTNPGQTILIHPQPDGVWRIDWQVGPEVDINSERSDKNMDQRIRALIGATPYEIIWLSDYRFHQRLLEQFRHGRVFFAGDAAHLVAPFGARGMNSAIQDVENLVWKLVLVLKGAAPQPLLDTYQTERWAAQLHNQTVTNATMLFMAPPTRWERFMRNNILRMSAFFASARKWVDSGKMSEPFVYQDTPIVATDNPDERWIGAPQPGEKVADLPCTVNGEKTFFRKLVGSGFLALYFPVDERDAMRFGQGFRAPEGIPVGLYFVLDEKPAGNEFNFIENESGVFAKKFGAQPGTLYIIRPDGHLAARRRQATAGEAVKLIEAGYRADAGGN
jgi:3-(3-hydroxy-phenyl)propionate hydroxylase